MSRPLGRWPYWARRRRWAAVPATARPVVTRRNTAPDTAPCENRAWPVLRAGHHLAAQDHRQGRSLRSRRQGDWRKRQPLSSDLARQVLGTYRKDGPERGKACRIATRRCRSAFCATDFFAMRLSRGPLVEVNAPGLRLRHDTPDNRRATGALSVQLRVGPGSGDDGPMAGGLYGAVRL
jgi:hypothetical protein